MSQPNNMTRLEVVDVETLEVKKAIYLAGHNAQEIQAMSDSLLRNLNTFQFFVRAVPSAAPVAAVVQDRQAAASPWISVADRLPEVGVPVMVYSPPTQHDWSDDIRIDFDCIDPDADEPTSWRGHNEHYEHFCCVAKPEGSIGPSEKAPYTHWMPLPAAPATTPGA